MARSSSTVLLPVRPSAMILIIIMGVALADQQSQMMPFPKKPGFWTYEGSLIDPVNGQRIANLVGVEHFQPLDADGPATPATTEALVIASRWKNIPHECFRSRKVFCYTDDQPHVNDGPVQPLQSYRRRANGPPRPVPLDQSVIVSESTVRYLAKGKCLYTEFANGKSAWGLIETSPSSSNGYDDSSCRRLKVFTTPLSRKVREEDLLQRIANLQESTTSAGTTTTTTTPRRHSIVQFGGMGSSSGRSSSSSTGPPRGVRETYEYRDNVVSYTRYGEGPVWYGLGRMAQLELTGRHYDYIIDDNDDNNDPIAVQRQSVPIPTVLADFIPRDFWSRTTNPATGSTTTTTTTGIVGSDPFPMNRARQQQQQQQNLGSTIGTWWTRLRSATSFSVGGHNDREDLP